MKITRYDISGLERCQRICRPRTVRNFSKRYSMFTCTYNSRDSYFRGHIIQFGSERNRLLRNRVVGTRVIAGTRPLILPIDTLRRLRRAIRGNTSRGGPCFRISQSSRVRLTLHDGRYDGHVLLLTRVVWWQCCSFASHPPAVTESTR